jgi:hypothetical protein
MICEGDTDEFSMRRSSEGEVISERDVLMSSQMIIPTIVRGT